MILDGRVARIDVDSATIPTAQGIKNGDSEARAIQKYGKRLRIQPHSYSPETGHYLTPIRVIENLGSGSKQRTGRSLGITQEQPARSVFAGRRIVLG